MNISKHAKRVQRQRGQSKRSQRNRILVNRKRRIANRLRPRVWAAREEPMLAAGNIHYELAERTRGIGVGGIGAIHRLARKAGLIDAIDRNLHLLKVHLPYHESGHALHFTHPSPPSGWVEGLHLQTVKHAWHTTPCNGLGNPLHATGCKPVPRMTGYKPVPRKKR